MKKLLSLSFAIIVILSFFSVGSVLAAGSQDQTEADQEEGSQFSDGSSFSDEGSEDIALVDDVLSEDARTEDLQQEETAPPNDELSDGSTPQNDFYSDVISFLNDSDLAIDDYSEIWDSTEEIHRGDAFCMLYRYAGTPDIVLQNDVLDDMHDMDRYVTESRWAFETGMLHGLATAFRKDEPITRAEAVYALWVMNGMPEAQNEASYSDVSSDLYFAQAVNWAFEQNLLFDIADGLFQPEEPLYYTQFALLLYRFHQRELSVETSVRYVETPAITSIRNVESGVEIKWDPVPGACKYRIFKKKDASSKWKKSVDIEGDDTSCVITADLISGRADRYTIQCITEDGDAASRRDTTGKRMVWLAPVAVSLQKKSDGIHVKWYPSPGEDGCILYRKLKTADKWTKIKSYKSSKKITYIDKNAAAGKTYCYAVRPYKTVSGTKYYGHFDQRYSITKWIGKPILRSVTNSSAGIKVQWKAVSGAEKYKVFRKAEGAGKWSAIAMTTKTSYTDKDSIQAGITYYYTVRCVNEDGTWASTYDTKGMSAKRLLATPELLSASNDGKGNIVIKWSAVDQAEKYRVYRKTFRPANGKE